MKTDHLSWIQERDVALIANALQEDKVVVGSSDTVLGLLANVTQQGFHALNTIKKREDKPYLLLVGSVNKVSLLSDAILPLAAYLMQKCWPGPLTIVIKAKRTLPAYMTSSDGTIAVRMPAHTGLLTVLRSFDALFSTSANLAGQPVPHTIDQLDVSFNASVAYKIVDDNYTEQKEPSTLIDCSGLEPRIIREGAYPIEKIHALLNEFKPS